MTEMRHTARVTIDSFLSNPMINKKKKKKKKR